jgi:hypothetical protein
MRLKIISRMTVLRYGNSECDNFLIFVSREGEQMF